MALGAWMRSLTPVGKPKSEVEMMVEEALSKDKWQTRGSLLHNLAAKTLKDETAKNIILPPVWKLLDATNSKEWHRVVKALAVVETCLKRASLPTIEDIRQNTAKVARWRNCSIIEDEKDVAGVMREKANLILAMCQDTQFLKEERRKYIEMTQKLAKKGAGEAPAPQQEGQQPPDGEMAHVASNNMEIASLGTQSTRTSEATGAPSLQDDRSTSSAQSSRPDYQEVRQRCAMVQKGTGITAFQAMRFLKETDWEVSKAIQAAGGPNKAASNPQSGERSASEDESESRGDFPPSSSSSSQRRKKHQQGAALEGGGGGGRKGEWSNMSLDVAGTASWPTSKPPWLSEGGKGGASSSASTASPRAEPSSSSAASARSPGAVASFGSGIWSSSGAGSEQLGKGAFSPHGSSIASGSPHSAKGAMSLGSAGPEQLGKGGSPTAWSPHGSHAFALSSPQSAKGSSPMSKGSEQQWAKGSDQWGKGGDQRFGKGGSEQPFFGKGSAQQAWTSGSPSSAVPFAGKGWSPMGKGNESQQLGKGSGSATAWSANAAAQSQSPDFAAAKGGYHTGKGGKPQAGRGAAFP